MTFLQNPILWALPFALLPIIIHLINQHRHRTVKWAAMMFLLDARKMTKGIARLRQILILAMRVLAILALILGAARPLASGWLAVTAGGGSDTVIVLLDRSASMEQQNLETGQSKRSTALEKLSDMLGKTSRNSRIVFIDSAALEVVELEDPSDLSELPSAGPTDTSADIPGLLEAALDYIAANRPGQTDIWLASDLRSSDWNTASGRWESLRTAFAELDRVNFFLLNYPETEAGNFGISVSNLLRRRGEEGMELVMDLSIRNDSPSDASETVPIELAINGARTAEEMKVSGGEMNLQGYTVDLGTGEPSGWGLIELPADSNPRDNRFYFVFDEAPVLKTVIVSDDSETANAIQAAASAAVDSSRRYETAILSSSRRAEVPWDETALLFWHAGLPEKGSSEAGLLAQYVESGKTLVLLAPEAGLSAGDGDSFLDFNWSAEDVVAPVEGFEVGWWRTSSGILRNTQNGDPLPLGSLRLFRIREFEGNTQSFLDLKDGRPVIARLISDYRGEIYVWGTLPRATHSSLASDGVAFFVMIHRALQSGGRYLSNAQILDAGSGVLQSRDEESWTRIGGLGDSAPISPEFQAGAFRSQSRWMALNRPLEEDDPRTINEDVIAELFSGLDYRIIEDSVNNQSSLAAEMWRAFLVAMAIALLVEAVLSLPSGANQKEEALV